MTKSIIGTSTKADQVVKRMNAAGIREEDLKEEFVASPGPGGQNVNKVATCVVLRHLPCGEVVKSHQFRTQLANRIRARELLLERFESRRLEERRRAESAMALERARKRKRSVKGKEKMLEGKRRRSERKQMRKKISGDRD
ncbi:MAG: peptide chain release factor-like protein [Candidatus Omnitrophota bacterium]